MAIISDPDGLLDGGVNPSTQDSSQNIYINTATRTIKVRNNAAAPDPSNLVLSNDGVTHQALYSFLKEEWKNDPQGKDLIAYPFPLVAITPEQFEWQFGWQPADDSSRSLIRTGGWREFSENNSLLRREYVGVISLGNIQGTPREEEAGVNQHKAYYAFFNGATNQPVTSATDFDYSGEVNQAVQTYLDSAEDGSPDYDYRTSVLKLFVRSAPYVAPQSALAWTFGQVSTPDIGIPAGNQLPYNTQRFPLVEGQDLNILDRLGATVDDATINAAADAGQKYSRQGDGPTIEYRNDVILTSGLGFTQDPVTTLPIGNVIDATSPTVTSLTPQELYSFVQFQLRQDSDIEFASGAAKIGRLQDELLEFVGPTLVTQRARNYDLGGEVFNTAIVDFPANQQNNIQFQDSNGNNVKFPFAAGVTLSFSEDILNDSDEAKVFVYYEFTREYGSGTSTVQIADQGPAAANSALDSANIILTNFSPSPIATAEGLDVSVTGDKYFKLTGMSNAVNNRSILEITAEFDNNNFAARTIDDINLVNETSAAGAKLRTHPINSPGALLIDSAGAASENLGGVVSTLATGGRTAVGVKGLGADDTLSFSYDFTNNSQKDRVSDTNVSVIVRAIGLANGSWVEATGTIGENNDNPITVISAIERNYSNPV